MFLNKWKLWKAHIQGEEKMKKSSLLSVGWKDTSLILRLLNFKAVLQGVLQRCTGAGLFSQYRLFFFFFQEWKRKKKKTSQISLTYSGLHNYWDTLWWLGEVVRKGKKATVLWSDVASSRPTFNWNTCIQTKKKKTRIPHQEIIISSKTREPQLLEHQGITAGVIMSTIAMSLEHVSPFKSHVFELLRGWRNVRDVICDFWINWGTNTRSHRGL